MGCYCFVFFIFLVYSKNEKVILISKGVVFNFLVGMILIKGFISSYVYSYLKFFVLNLVRMLVVSFLIMILKDYGFEIIKGWFIF